MNSIKSSIQPLYPKSRMDSCFFLGSNSTKNPSRLSRSVINNLESHDPNNCYAALTPRRRGIQGQKSANLIKFHADLRDWDVESRSLVQQHIIYGVTCIFGNRTRAHQHLWYRSWQTTADRNDRMIHVMVCGEATESSSIKTSSWSCAEASDQCYPILSL